MKKEIFYLIGAVAGALLVLLAVPLGNAYIGNYLSVYIKTVLRAGYKMNNPMNKVVSPRSD